MNSELEQQFKKIKDLLIQTKKILTVSHGGLDADALGSMLALNLAFKKMGQGALLYSADDIPPHFSFLPGVGDIKKYPLSDGFDAAFCLDYGDFQRLELPFNLPEEKIITIDHHLQGNQKGNIKIIEPDYSSTAEIIFFLLRYLGVETDKDMATCLLSGIIYDTGGLKHISTSSQTLKVVSELLQTGVVLEEISQKVLTLGKSLIDSKIWAEVLSRIVVDRERKFAFSWVSYDDFEKYQISFLDLDGLSSLISTISDTSFSLFLIEKEKGKIDGSLRSEAHKGKNITDMAKALGGGGHPFAAGFKQEGTIEGVLKKVYNFIDDHK